MRKMLVISAVLVGFPAAPAFAQAVGPRDGTANVTSDRIGMPGTTSDPMSEYRNRRALNNLPGQDGKALAGKLGPARSAKASELIAGAIVNDKTGAAIAKIDEVDADGVVVSIGTAKVKVPTDAFGHNRAGLLLDMTRAQFEQIVANANKAS